MDGANFHTQINWISKLTFYLLFMFVHFHASIHLETKSQERQGKFAAVTRPLKNFWIVANCCKIQTKRSMWIAKPCCGQTIRMPHGWMDGPLGCGRATVDTVAVAVAVAVTGRYSGWMGYKSKCDNGQRHREVYITLPIKRSDTNVSLLSF